MPLYWTTTDGQATIHSDVATLAVMETKDSHPSDVQLSDDIEAVDYREFGGDNNMGLSFDDDDVWGSKIETPSNPDTSKIGHLSTEDLKAIDNLEIETTSREVQGSMILLCILLLPKHAFS